MPAINCGHVSNVTWRKAAGHNYVISGALHIWRLQLSANLHLVNTIESILSADELVRSGGYLQEKDRQRFVLSRVMLRTILAKYLNRSAGHIEFEISECRKPSVRSVTDLHYNVSHAGDWVLIAIAGSPVGIDIEHINQGLDYTQVLPVCFNSHEAHFIQNNADSVKQFYELWTRKESLVKATGKGLDDDMPFVPCTDGLHEALPEKIGSDKNWNVLSITPGIDYVASISFYPDVKQVLFLEQDGL